MICARFHDVNVTENLSYSEYKNFLPDVFVTFTLSLVLFHALYLVYLAVSQVQDIESELEMSLYERNQNFIEPRYSHRENTLMNNDGINSY